MYTAGQLQDKIEVEIRNRFSLNSKSFENLYIFVFYVLEEGGKRIRPLLLLLAYNLFADDVCKALPAAISIEVFHNFTLLHDDIMDNADVRRNRATVHNKFGDNSAILSGDVMSFLSYDLLLKSESKHVIELAKLFTQTAMEVCEGQQYDMDFEKRMDVTEEEYLEMIKLKTAVLLACSLKAGAILAGVEAVISEQFYHYGINLGLAFQLQDDLLDSFGDQKFFGKKIGGDILANKKTFLLINALKNSDARQRNTLLS